MSTKEDHANQATNQQQVLVTVELHNMNVKLHFGTELHLDAKLQNEVDAHSNSKISVHERDANEDVHSDFKINITNEETRAEPRLSKYVKRPHLTTQIIGDKDARPMTRNKLRNDTCLLSMKEPILVRDELEYVD